jgi:cytochrome b
MTMQVETDHLPYQNVPVTKTRIWDPLVRLFHWAVAALFAIAWIWKSETAIHENAGKIILALLLLRIGWGLAGPNSARFSHFVRDPVETAKYLWSMVKGNPYRTLGYNPFSAALIMAQLLGLAVLTLSGLLMSSTAFWGSKAMAALHNAAAYVVLGLIALHLIDVLLASLRQKENLPAAMITGNKADTHATLPYEGIKPMSCGRFGTVALWTFLSFASWLALDTVANASLWRMDKLLPFAAQKNGCEIAVVSGPALEIYPQRRMLYQASRKGSATQFQIAVPLGVALQKRPDWPTDGAILCPNV